MTGVTTNAELAQRYRAVLPSYVSPLYAEPISIDHGQGGYVFDVEGNRYLDFFGGVLTTMVGHNNPAVTAAVQAQAAKVMHTSTLYLSEPMIELAERIAAISGIPDARVFFTTSGSEANDTAILLATSYRRSNEVLAMRNSYHGRSFTAQAITSHSSWSSTALAGLSVNFVHGGKGFRLGLRRAAGHDDCAFRIFPTQLANLLPCLAHRLCRYRTGVDHDSVRKTRLLAEVFHGFGLIGIEPTTKRGEFGRLDHFAESTNSTVKVPENTCMVSPVIQTPSSAQSMCRVPPSRSIRTCRPVRPRRAAATAVAQDEDPEAKVGPTPRSQTRIRR